MVSLVSQIDVRAAARAAVASLAIGLAGCGADSSLLGSPSVTEKKLVPPITSRPVSRMVSYRPALGPPDAIGNELTRQLNEAATEQGIALIIDPGTKTDLALRGYVTALRKGPTVNITYLWDVLDASGKRVSRISGEENLKDGVNSNQPWDAMTPVVSRMIAQKTMTQFAQWAGANGAPVASGGATSTVGAAALAASPR